MTDDTLHAYFAGFFDGEGCIYIGVPTKQVILSVSQNDVRPLLLLREHYGGNVYPPRGRRTWNMWSMGRRSDVTKALEVWLPLLIVKHEQAEKALTFARENPVRNIAPRRRKHYVENVM